MNIKETLQKKFNKVNDAFFEKEGSLNFLRVEVNLRTLDEVTEISREISAYIDEIITDDQEFILDIYSAGTDQSIDLSNLGNYIDSNVLVKLKKQIKDKNEFEGKIIEVSDSSFVIRWNAKGQFRKTSIEISNIDSIKSFARK